MKLLCVIDNLMSGGAQGQLAAIACGLKRKRHIVEFFVYYPDDHFKSLLDKDQVPVRFHPKPTRYSLKTPVALRTVIKEGRFDTVLAFLETPVVYAEFACLTLAGVKLIVSERNTVFGGRTSLGLRAKSILHLRADAIVTNSHAHRRWMEVRFPYLRNRLCTIWNGVDTAIYTPRLRRRAAGPLRLIGIGRVFGQKNLPILARTLRCCRELGLDARVDWAGRFVDEAYRKRAQTALNEEGVADLWTWLGERRDIPELLSGYDALILPSLWEGLPNTVCEALSCGLPVLASSVSDNASLVKDGVNGFVFDPCDPAAMSQAIGKLHNLDAADRLRMSGESRRFAVEKLSLNACINAFESLLLEPGAHVKSFRTAAS